MGGKFPKDTQGSPHRGRNAANAAGEGEARGARAKPEGEGEARGMFGETFASGNETSGPGRAVRGMDAAAASRAGAWMPSPSEAMDGRARAERSEPARGTEEESRHEGGERPGPR